MVKVSYPRAQIRVAVIGAGFGGVAAASYLASSGFTNFLVFERSAGAGGVWYQNRYPGAEVDTFSDWYSFRFKRYDWPKPHSPQPVLEAYINETIDDLGMRDKFKFNSEVTRISWDDSRQMYTVLLADGRSEDFNVVVSAIGLFNTPNYPKWFESNNFAGPAFHASRWEHEHDLRDKRVALVGAGSSGAQIAVALAPQVKHLFVFQRDPTWVLQKNDTFYSIAERQKRRNRHVYRWGRLRHAYNEQSRFVSGKLFLEGSEKNLAETKVAQAYIDTTLADVPDLRDAVTPNHPFFAKRNVKADGYYETLRRDNVTFVRGEVISTSVNGVIDNRMTNYDVDVVVMATGFKASEYLGDIEVTGRFGLSLHEVWKSAGGAEAFLGMTVPRFPNFYMLYGPNTNVGQIVFNLETQSRYLVRDLKRMSRSGIRAIEVSESAYRLYNRWLQSNLKGTIWASTKNYHKSETGKLVVPFPRASIQYWAMSRLFRRLSHRVVDVEA